MAPTEYVHGGTDAREVARLEKQAAFVSGFTFSTLALQAKQRVLDLATGVGAMGTRLQQACPGAHLVGIDVSQSQLRAARRNHPQLPVLRGDATQLPFADDTFDRVHCSWLLEHVEKPLPILAEVRRVLKPDGFCQFIEVDNNTFDTNPKCPAAQSVLHQLNEAQLRGGGDPFIGKRLGQLFKEVGFSTLEVEQPQLRGDSSNPTFFKNFVEEFAEIFEGLDESLGSQSLALIQEATAELHALLQQPGAWMRYSPTIVRGWK